MLTILSTLGGAAAMKLLNKKPKDVKELKKREQELRKLVKELEKEAAEVSKEKEQALLELKRQAEELRAQVSELSSVKGENEALKEENAALHEELVTADARMAQLTLHNTDLQAARDEVVQQNDNLLRQKSALSLEMGALKEAHDNAVKDYEAQLEQLRQSVSDVVGRMLANTITDMEAATAVRALGCELEWVEPPPPPPPALALENGTHPDSSVSKDTPWAFQPGLLLESAEGRQRLERLVASGMLRNNSNDTSTAPARIPMITFPSHFGQRPAPGGLLSARSAGAKTQQAVPAIGGGADVQATGQRDQHAPPSSATPPPAPRNNSRPGPVIAPSGTPALPAAQSKNHTAGVSWTYSLQGSNGSTYLAKVPAASGEQAAPAFMLSTSPALAPPTACGGGADELMMPDSASFGAPQSKGLITKF